MSEPTPPKIEFPCHEYPVSVVANTTDGFTETLESIIIKHCPEYDPDSLRVTASRNGKYQSFRFCVVAQSEAQLAQLHEELKATGCVHMVL